MIIRKLAAAGAAAIASIAMVVAPAQGAACPPGCVLAGVISGTGIVPDPNNLNFIVDWAAVDATGSTVSASLTGKVQVVVPLTSQATPTGPAVARGDGYVRLDPNGDGLWDEYFYVTAIRTGYPGTGALSVDGAKFHPGSGNPKYGFTLDAQYLGFSNGTWRLTGAAASFEIFD